MSSYDFLSELVLAAGKVLIVDFNIHVDNEKDANVVTTLLQTCYKSYTITSATKD